LCYLSWWLIRGCPSCLPTEGRLDTPREDLLDAAWGIAVVECDQLANLEIADALASRSKLPVANLTLIVVPTKSVAGATQIAGRINESVVFTMEESLGIDCSCVSQLLATVPIALSADVGALSLVTPDDFIHYLGRVTLTIDRDVSMDMAELASQLAFRSTPIYGKLFSELLSAAGGVFEAIPGLIDLNKVAQMTVIDQQENAMNRSCLGHVTSLKWTPRRRRDPHKEYRLSRARCRPD